LFAARIAKRNQLRPPQWLVTRLTAKDHFLPFQVADAQRFAEQSNHVRSLSPV